MTKIARFASPVVLPRAAASGPEEPRLPRTEAARRALLREGRAAADDLVFLERWESQTAPGIGATLRARQIRRANHDLATAIRAELRGGANPEPSPADPLARRARRTG